MDWTWKIKETGMSLWVNKFRIQYCNKFEKRFSLEYIQWLPQFVFPWGKVSLAPFECNCIREMFERKIQT